MTPAKTTKTPKAPRAAMTTKAAKAAKAPKAAADAPTEDAGTDMVISGEVLGARDLDAEDDSSKAEGLRTTVVPFHGRLIRVRMPTLEQVAVYRRLAAKFTAMSEKDAKVDADQAIRAYDRAISVISSVIVEPDDVEWLEDELLARRLDLESAAPLMDQAMAELRKANEHLTQNNRQERREARRGKARRAE